MGGVYSGLLFHSMMNKKARKLHELTRMNATRSVNAAHLFLLSGLITVFGLAVIIPHSNSCRIGSIITSINSLITYFKRSTIFLSSNVIFCAETPLTKSRYL
jgi:hypothetical protein